MCLLRNKQQGFSVIELVLAILIIGIIATVAMSRLLEGDTYNAAVVRDQIISLARSGHHRALGRSDVALILRPNGDELEVITAEAFVDANNFATLQSSSIDARSVTIAGDVNIIASCGASPGSHALSNAAPMVIQYNELGDLYRGGVISAVGYPLAASTAMRLCINNDPIVSICFSPAGFAYAGDCE
tara:strand:- start:502 stop:1062 length:561 start_codon:yes stop_codon:yes gene_type:complete